MIIKTEDIKSIGGYPIYRRVEDYAMAMEMYVHGYKGYIMKDVLIDYRMNADGYKKKKFKYRLVEVAVRFKYYRKLKVKWYCYIYVIKPILVGIIPKCFLQKYQKSKK